MAEKQNGHRSNKRIRPGLTPESREDQLVALAIDLAEKQLLEGTASAQVISHFLKIGSTKRANRKRNSRRTKRSNKS